MADSQPGLNPHPLTLGFRAGWASRALLWLRTAETLAGSLELGEELLSPVALFLCLQDAFLLVDGKRAGSRLSVPGDQEALSGCPYTKDELLILLNRARGLRDEVLHLSTKLHPGRELGTSWTQEAPYLTVRASVGPSNAFVFESISQPEMTQILEKLKPWLRRQWERLVNETTGIDVSVLPID
jgi:hypothetical protein